MSSEAAPEEVKVTESSVTLATSPSEVNIIAPKKYVFRFGSATWFIELFVTAILGSILTGVFYWNSTKEFYDDVFDVVIGYAVWVSTLQGAFIKNPRSGPYPLGFIRYPITVGGAIGFYYLHMWIIESVIGIPEGSVVPGQFVWIVTAFLLYGVDEAFFKDKLAEWLHYPILKAVFWYIVSWCVWAITFVSPLIMSGKDNLDITMFFWWLASLQLLVLTKIFMGSFCKEWLDEMFTCEVTTKATTLTAAENKDAESQTVSKKEICAFKRGFFSFGLAIVFAWTFAFVIFAMVNVVFGDEAPNALLWKHVLNICATPLVFVVPVGIYSDSWKSWHGECDQCVNKCHHGRFVKGQMSWGQVTLFRVMMTFICWIASYFFYHLVIAQVNLLGTHPWYAHYDLSWNFSVAVFGLAHNWFTGKIGLVKQVDA